MKRPAPLKPGEKPCLVPKCRKPIGPSGILCRDHYRVVPLCWRKPRNEALKRGDKVGAERAARKCIEVAGGPDA